MTRTQEILLFTLIWLSMFVALYPLRLRRRSAYLKGARARYKKLSIISVVIYILMTIFAIWWLWDIVLL